MAIATLAVRILADAERFNRGMQSAEARMKRFEGQAKKLGMVSLALGGAITAVGLNAVRAAQKQQIIYKSLEGAINRTGASYDHMEDRIKAVFATQQKLTNFGDTDSARMLTKLTQQLGDADMALAHLAITQDLAAAELRRGTDPAIAANTALEAMGRLLQGDVMGLKKWIPEITAATTQTEAMALVMKRYKGTAEDMADPLKQMQNYLGDLNELMGDAFLPVVTAAMKQISSLAARITKWAEAHPKLSKGVFMVTGAIGALLVVLGLTAFAFAGASMMARNLAGATRVLFGWTNAETGARSKGLVVLAAQKVALIATTAAKLAAAIATKAVTVATWLWNAALYANPIGLVVLAIAALIAGIVLAVKYWDKVTGAVMKAWDWFWKLGKPIKILAAILLLPLAPIIALIAGIVLLVKHWDKLWSAIPKSFGDASKAIKKLFHAGFGWLLPGGILSRAMSWLRSTLANLWGRVTSIWDSVKRGLGVDVEPSSDSKTWMATAWNTIKSFWATTATDGLDIAVGLQPGSSAKLWAAFKKEWDAAGNVVVATWKWATASATAFAGTITSTATATWKWATASATAFAGAITGAVVAKWKWATASATAFAGAITGAVVAKWKWATGVAAPAASAVTTTINVVKGTVSTAAQTILDLTSKTVTLTAKVLKTGYSIITSAGAWVSSVKNKSIVLTANVVKGTVSTAAQTILDLTSKTVKVSMEIATSITGFFADKWDDLLSFLGIGGSSNKRKRAVSTSADTDPNTAILRDIKAWLRNIYVALTQGSLDKVTTALLGVAGRTGALVERTGPGSAPVVPSGQALSQYMSGAGGTTTVTSGATVSISEKGGLAHLKKIQQAFFGGGTLSHSVMTLLDKVAELLKAIGITIGTTNRNLGYTDSVSITGWLKAISAGGTTSAGGTRGPTGATGATGPRGPRGSHGAPGPKGLKGDKGDKGDKGAPRSHRHAMSFAGSPSHAHNIQSGGAMGRVGTAGPLGPAPVQPRTIDARRSEPLPILTRVKRGGGSAGGDGGVQHYHFSPTINVSSNANPQQLVKKLEKEHRKWVNTLQREGVLPKGAVT